MSNSNSHYQRNKERLLKKHQTIIIKKMIKKEQKNIKNNKVSLQEQTEVNI